MEEEIKKLQNQIKNKEPKGSQVLVVYTKSDRKFTCQRWRLGCLQLDFRYERTHTVN